MRLASDVVVAGSGVGRFGRLLDSSLVDLAVPTIESALADANVPKADIQCAFVGNAFGGMIQGQESILGQVVLAAAGIHSIPVHNVKNACSSGADAMHLAWNAVAFGQYDRVLVVGVEKMTHIDKSRAMTALGSATDRPSQDPNRSVFMDVNAERALKYMREYGATKRHFAVCVVKNRGHAQLNENAAVREPISIGSVLDDRVVIEPLTRAMCGGISDGAASVILVSSRYAKEKYLKGPRVVASALVGGDPGRQDGPNATARAARQAFEQAGIDPRDVSLAEVHDPTAPQEFLDIEDIGLCERGGAVEMLEQGASSLGGRLPVNVSGGLTSRGHPVGATGVAQIVEIVRQLQGRAGKSQVEGARVGLAQMAGGLLGRDSAVACVHILTS